MKALFQAGSHRRVPVPCKKRCLTSYRIRPLTRKTLEEAKKLVNKVFPRQTKWESSDHWLTYSLEQSERNELKHGRHAGVQQAGYWVFARGSDVVGIVGLYEYGQNVRKVSWLGWFCVHPDFRRKGIGSKLLKYAISKAEQSGKKYLRLYTTTDPNEANAQKLYEKHGLAVIERNAGRRGKYTIFHRQLTMTQELHPPRHHSRKPGTHNGMKGSQQVSR
jgi:ribosomal protein S18 acetylase RimI-like enzyme